MKGLLGSAKLSGNNEDILMKSCRANALRCFAVFLLFAASHAFAQTTPGPQPVICSRSCWNARSASGCATMSSLTRWIVHHTASTSQWNTTGQAASAANVRGLQNYDIDTEGYCDIEYHWMIDKFGNIFEARYGGLTGQLIRGAHDGNNSNSHGSSFMGYFHPGPNGETTSPYNVTPPQVMLDQLYALIAWRMPSGWSPYGSSTYNGNTVGYLDGHRKVKATACPGDRIHPNLITENYNGGTMRNTVAALRTVAVNNASVVSITYPATVTPGQVFSASVTMNNNGTKTWSVDGTPHNLGSQNPQDNSRWGLGRVGLPGGTSVAPGANVTFTFNCTAPTAPGTYAFDWKMVEESVAWFGATATGSITVSNPTGPPVINSHPQNQSIVAGAAAAFTAGVSGATPITYQWRFNGTSISGATGSSYTRNSTQVSDLGQYSLFVSNALGTATSSNATLQFTEAVLFFDNFEVGNLDNWTTAAGSFAISTTQNQTGGGSKSAQLDSSGDRIYHNLGTELEGRARVTFWMYDSGAQTRCFGEIRGYTGNGYANGSLAQLFAIGRYGVGFGTNNTGTLAGEVVDSTKYQGRVVAGANTGWFNLNAARSTGWHKFEIERDADGTTIRFYVDGTLDRTITAATYVTWDSVVLGSIASGTTAGDAWYDDVQVSYYNAPGISVQPLGKNVNAGSNTTFTVTASGNVTGYQWRKDGTNISGATGSAHSIGFVQMSHAGAYSVQVLNSVGFTTSQNALLTVIAPTNHTQMGTLNFTPQGPRVAITGGIGLSFTLETSSNLVDWLPVDSALNTNGTVLLNDHAASTNAPQRFYRAKRDD